jgi:hypothetical protein
MKLTSLIAALAASAGLALSARAVPTVSTTANDLVLGFRAVSGTGSSFNLEVDLGAFTDYTSGAYSTGVHQITALSAADLSATYGSDWNSGSSTVRWGIVGNDSDSNNNFVSNVFASKVASVAGVQSVPYDAVFGSTVDSAVGNVSSVVFGLNGQTSTANSSSSALVTASNGVSWSSNQFIQPGISFNVFDTDNVFENNTNFTSGYKVSDLYQLTDGAVTYVGSFGLASDGKLYYSSSAASFSAVPEPSTYAAILGVAALGFVAVRRRRQARLAAAA